MFGISAITNYCFNLISCLSILVEAIVEFNNHTVVRVRVCFVCVASYFLFLWVVALFGLCIFYVRRIYFRWKKCYCKGTFVFFFSINISQGEYLNVVSRTCSGLHQTKVFLKKWNLRHSRTQRI